MLLVISAPSGTGKTTLIKRLLKEVSQLKLSVSYTTRPPRANEKDGVDYFFVSRQQFDAMTQQGAFLESAEVYGAFYGTASQTVADNEKKGLITVLDVDSQGALAVKKKNPKAVLVFIMPPSLQELENRLSKRGTEDAATVEKRLKEGLNEIARKGSYDYVILNQDLEVAVSSLKEVIEKEKKRLHASS